VEAECRNAFQYFERLARVKSYLEDHISEPFSVEAAAKIACLSEKYFSTFFHRKTGVRFTEWVNAMRIGRARELIGERNRSVADVASDVGFQDLRTFERAFKRHSSMTPLDYKKSVQPNSCVVSPGGRSRSALEKQRRQRDATATTGIVQSGETHSGSILSRTAGGVEGQSTGIDSYYDSGPEGG
jgi:AraC-like DNA-binding protein